MKIPRLLLLLATALAISTTIIAEPIRRVAFLGDSITAGVGVKDKNNRYSSVTTRLLAKQHPEIEELNFGRSSRALSQQEMTSYVKSILDKSPDAVVIQWGVNDCWWGYSTAQFAHNYDRLVSKLLAAKPDLLLVLMTLVPDYRGDTQAWSAKANVAIQEVAGKYNCRVAYVHHAFDHNKDFHRDNVHPNEKGAAVMAREIVEAFAAEPLSKENLRLRFDDTGEARFLNYVFTLNAKERSWVVVDKLSVTEGISFHAAVPFRFSCIGRTVKDGTGTIRDATGKTMTTFKYRKKILKFEFDPAGGVGPYTVELK